MRRITCYTLAVFFASMLGVAAFAQTAQFSGRVTDPQDKVVVGANVRIFNQATGVEHNVKTNSDGLYVAPFIQPGTYQIYVQAQGFSTVSSQPLTVTVGQALVFDVQLKVGSAEQQITVDASDHDINTTDASVSTVIDRNFVENIPLNGRSFQDLIGMTPGVVTATTQATSQNGIAYSGDFSVNGQRTEANYYTVDGVSGNITSGNGAGGFGAGGSGSLAGVTALGTTQSLISVDALQEFRVESSTYSAEYGRNPGGQFSLSTRSGTDKIHGTLYDYLRNNFFDANDWFNDYYGKATPALRQNDFGGTFGGPILIPHLYDGRKKSFFFVSYEGLRLTQPQAAFVLYVPDTYMRQQATAAVQPILNAFPMPNGIDYGSSTNPSLAQFIQPFSLPSSINSTSLRFDHALGSRWNFFFRFGDTPSQTTTRYETSGAETILNNSTININARTFTAGFDGMLTQSLSNHFRVGYASSNENTIGTIGTFGSAVETQLAADMAQGSYPNSEPVVFLDFSGVGESALYGQRASTNEGNQLNLVDTVGLSKGRHQFKMGIDYRRIASPATPASPLMEGLYTSSKAVIQNDTTEAVVLNRIGATPIFNETSAFVQDEWSAAKRLNLSFGVRWEIDPPPTSSSGGVPYTLTGTASSPQSLALAPEGTPLWKTTWHNLAPRLGGAWIVNPNQKYETVIRSGVGVFFDTDNEPALNGYSGIGYSVTKTYLSVAFPLTTSQVSFSPSTAAPYTADTIYAFPAHMQLPYTLEWNTSLQQALGMNQSITISYVGANGRRLISSDPISLTSQNSSFGTVVFFLGGYTSNYQSLQTQFQRTVSHGLHVLASYTWSHAIDYGSEDAAIPVERGNSDLDVRNNFVGGATWDIPQVRRTNALLGEVVNGWGVDGRLMARTAFPVTLNGSLAVDTINGDEYYGGLNLVPNTPVYLYGSQYPGGKAINKAAFAVPASGLIGTAPRNFVRGFGATQINLAVRRDFGLGEKATLQFRAETFNLLNHPNFGLVDATYTDATFGRALEMLNQSLVTMASQYQQGGPRSMQFALRVSF